MIVRPFSTAGPVLKATPKNGKERERERKRGRKKKKKEKKKEKN